MDKDDEVNFRHEEILANIKRTNEEETDFNANQQEHAVEADTSSDLNGQDPLQDVGTKNNFCCLIKDDDILYDTATLGSNMAKQETIGKSRVKRCRTSKSNKEWKCSTGQIWYTECNSVDENEELSMPDRQPRGKGPAEGVDNILASWMLLFDLPMLENTMLYINEYVRKNPNKETHHGYIQLHELRAWLGLCYLCGVFRNATHNGPLNELWTLELGNAIFRATMTFKRFEYIAECLGQPEYACHLLKLWQKFIINCRSYYSPSSWCSIDEHIVPLSVDAKCNIQFSLPKNPDVRGLRLVTLCDAKTLYMVNAVLGKQKLATETEIMQLVCDIKTTGRQLTLSKRYMSMGLSKKLLQRQLNTSGILSTDAPEVPVNWTSNIGDTLYSDGKLLVNTESGYLLANGLNGRTDAKKVYEKSSQAPARFQEIASRFSCSYATPPLLETLWPLKFFFTILDYAAVNTWILLRLSANGDALIELRDYQRQLGLFLTQQRLQHRLRMSASTPLVIKLHICEMFDLPTDRLLADAANNAKLCNSLAMLDAGKASLPDKFTLGSRHGDKMRRCKPCTQMKRQTKTRTRCQQCLAHRCGKHLVARCFQCMGITPEQLPPTEQNCNTGEGAGFED